MTNIIVSKQKVIQVSANSTGGVISTTTPVTLKNTPTIINTGNGVSSLSALSDVVVDLVEANGSTLVWDSSLNKYVVQPLDLSYVTGGLDGGTF